MQQRAILTRTAILAAARDEFSAKGFDGARVDAVAARAGVNKQRIYAYFAGKAGLFAAVLRILFEELAEEESRLLRLGAADVPRLGERMLACYVAIHTRHPDLWRLLAWENLGGGKHSSGLAGVKAPVLSHLRRLYLQGQREGTQRADVPFEAFVFNLLAVSYFMVSNRHTLKRTTGIDCAKPAVRHRLCQAVIAQMRPVRA